MKRWNVLEAVTVGMIVMLAGTIPRNIVFAANLRQGAQFPWAVVVVAVYLWLFWLYVGGAGPPDSTRLARERGRRSKPVHARAWTWSLLAGGFGILALVVALRLVNRMAVLPPQRLPDLTHVPRGTVLALLLTAAPVAGVVEETAFRGYMQKPIEEQHGLLVAILITGTMFAVAHLDFTPILWPYYVAVAALYGGITHVVDSIRPAILLHTAGNLYSNLDLWLHGHAEWQAPARSGSLVWQTGPDTAFWTELVILAVAAIVTIVCFTRLRSIVSDRSSLTAPCQDRFRA